MKRFKGVAVHRERGREGGREGRRREGGREGGRQTCIGHGLPLLQESDVLCG